MRANGYSNLSLRFSQFGPAEDAIADRLLAEIAEDAGSSGGIDPVPFEDSYASESHLSHHDTYTETAALPTATHTDGASLGVQSTLSLDSCTTVSVRPATTRRLASSTGGATGRSASVSLDLAVLPADRADGAKAKVADVQVEAPTNGEPPQIGPGLHH